MPLRKIPAPDRARADLTDAERLLWEAYPSGAEVRLGDEMPDAGATEPGHTVRAEVISALLLGARESEPGRVPAIRLRGARITGCVNVSGGVVACELRLDRCRLDEVPDFSNARTRHIRINNCHLPGFDGGGLSAEGYLSLSGCVFTGQVKLVRAQLVGGFRMNRTQITTTGDWALYAGGLTVEAGMFARRAVVTGGIRLTGARIGGGLFMEHATLRNPGAEALAADSMVVEDAMECGQGFTAEGSMRLRGVKINGVLSFSGAVLNSPGNRALHLSHAQVQELILATDGPVVGEVTLLYSRVGVILDRQETWPAELRLNGLTYDSLRGTTSEARLAWVARDARGFHPQPYEQLAAWLRRSGREDLARKALHAKQRARRRTMARPGRIGGLVLDWTVGYGYRPWIAALWLVILVVAGSTIFSIEEPNSIREQAEQPSFNAFIYTLDLLVPVTTFGHRTAWDPVGWTQWVAYGLIVMGWILATALIAGVMRVLRPSNG